AVESLIEALQDKFEVVRGNAAAALGKIGDECAVEPLIKAFKAWSAGLGLEEAGKALGKIRDGRGIEVLRACLEDPDEELRLAAADSLLEIGELEPGGNVKGYFIVEPPKGDGLCDDNACPCWGMEPIPRGEGYLYIPMRVVNNRRSARTESALEHSTNREIRNTAGFLGATVVQQGANFPIYCCREGAKLRGLDLQIAAKDAAFWLDTGLVPLRPTPKAGSSASILVD
ncbi:MAG: hypothetical protein MUO54_06900, partial [Anaerolineales bacterium]|nr:hypothetical protein [Anaerolineales bacterium]